MRAARYLGVPPWELEQQSILWMNRALTAEYAENWAEAEATKRAQAKV